MKVIFLDVDGVLNTFGNGDMYTVSKRLVKRLSKIVEATDAKIVLSSSWRNSLYHLAKLNKALFYKGLIIFSSTPTLMSLERGDEIQCWLDDVVPDNYVILDDSKDMLDTQMDNFVNTDPYKGLTDEDVEKAIKILNKVVYNQMRI